MQTRRWKRFGCAIFTGFGALLLFALAFVQVSQYVMRARAQSLLTDMHELRPGRGDWAQFNIVITHWGQWAEDDGNPCSSDFCEYTIELTDWILDIVSHVTKTPQAAEYVLNGRAFRLLHANLPLVRVNIEIKAARTTGLRQTVHTQVLPGQGPDWMGPGPAPAGYSSYRSGNYVVLAEAVSVGARGGPAEEPGKEPHPHYKLYRPGGCEGCMGFYAEYKETASEAEYNFVSGFNLSCITRWTPCTTEADLLPGPWKEYRAEHPGRAEW